MCVLKEIIRSSPLSSKHLTSQKLFTVFWEPHVFWSFSCGLLLGWKITSFFSKAVKTKKQTLFKKQNKTKNEKIEPTGTWCREKPQWFHAATKGSQKKKMKNIEDSTVLSKILFMCSDSGFSCIERPGNSSTDDGSVCYKPVTHATRQHADFSYIKFISELCLFFTHSAYNKRRAVRVIVLAWTCRENVVMFSFNSDIIMAVSSNKCINHPPVMYQCILLKCTGLK